jgi:hypothetical protein
MESAILAASIASGGTTGRDGELGTVGEAGC